MPGGAPTELAGDEGGRARGKEREEPAKPAEPSRGGQGVSGGGRCPFPGGLGAGGGAGFVSLFKKPARAAGPSSGRAGFGDLAAPRPLRGPELAVPSPCVWAPRPGLLLVTLPRHVGSGRAEVRGRGAFCVGISPPRLFCIRKHNGCNKTLMLQPAEVTYMPFAWIRERDLPFVHP